RARSDRGDHDRTVAEIEALAVEFHVLARRERALVVADGGAAAFALETADRFRARLAVRGEHAHRIAIAVRHVTEQHAILRALRTRERRLDVGEIELERR